jgi:precorrin-2 C(20)-methyltransferase
VDVIAYPVSNEDTTIGLNIARAYINPAAIEEAVHIPMTVRMPRGEFAAKNAIYEEAASRMAAHLQAGRNVAYLCEGDPLFYGTAIYLLNELRDAHRIQVIPGVTSMTAAAAAIPFPLVARFETLSVLTGPLPDNVLRPTLDKAGSVVILKIGRHFDRIRGILEETGRAEHAWLVERATTADQRIALVRDLPPGDKPYFSLILCYSGAEFWL